MNQNRFPFLDGIRGIAAIIVVMHHTASLWPFSVVRGYLAVDLFFLLSGFVIGHAYDEKLRTGVLSPSAFMKIRAIRLYPMYFLGTVICIPAVLYGFLPDVPWVPRLPTHMEATTLLLCTAFLVPFNGPGVWGLFPVNPPFWSLFFEVVVNAGYAVARPLLAKRNLFLVTFISGFGIVLVARYFGHINRGSGWGALPFVSGLIRAVFGIFMGLSLQRIFPSISQRFASFAWAPWLGIAAVLTILLLPSSSWDKGIIDVAAVLVVFPAAVLACSCIATSRFDPPLLILGRISYPIYVIHYPIIFATDHFTEKAFSHSGWVVGVFFIAGLGITSLALEWLYDIPVRRKLGTFKRAREVKPSIVV